MHFVPVTNKEADLGVLSNKEQPFQNNLHFMLNPANIEKTKTVFLNSYLYETEIRREEAILMKTQHIRRITLTSLKPRISSFWLIAIGFVLVKLLIHFLTSTTYELHRDEMLYFDQFFWFLSSYLVFRMVNRNNPGLWIWIGLVFGLSFLNKYSVMYSSERKLESLLHPKGKFNEKCLPVTIRLEDQILTI
jgi:hypothetical protein